MQNVWILSNLEDCSYENKRLLESFKNKNINAKLVDSSLFDIIVNKDIKSGIVYNGKVVDLPDLFLVRYGAGISKFLLALIRQMEKAGVICINSSESIECVKDKLHTSQILSSQGIPIPTTMAIRFPVNPSVVTREIGYPCVVKIVTGSYGEGVYLVKTEKEFKEIIEFIQILDTSKTLLVQEYMGERPGEDLRVLVVGGKVIGAMKRSAPPGDFRANISNGGVGESFELTDEIEYIARETSKVLNLDIAGVDLLFDKFGFRVCEANSNPGFNGFEKYCNVDVADIITEYTKFRLNIH